MFEEDARRSTVSKGPRTGGSAVHSEWKAIGSDTIWFTCGEQTGGQTSKVALRGE